MPKDSIPESELIEAWFPRNRAGANLRPGLYKMEGSLLPGHPNWHQMRAWWFNGQELHQVTVTVHMGEDYLPLLAVELEKSYQKFG